VAGAWLAWQPPAHAVDWSATSAWVLQGDRFELGSAERTILRIEHANHWAYGDNYLFVDLIRPPDDGSDTLYYAEFAPRFSLGKLTGHDLSWGPIQDILLAPAINSGDDFRAYLYGVGLNLQVPGFSYFQLNAYLRDDQNLPGTTWQLTPVWLYPFTVGGLNFNFQGFIDYAGAEGPAARNLLVVPRLWLDLGAMWGMPGKLEAGVEYLYWNNKYGVAGITESVVQPALRWTF
jgi:nucleoside-specific outer membrane channel protein Tsx